ncbi:MAG: tRNA (adenosine(37)-N6)-threonylcarbamoyltransferase complex dimerization subunit type 1 TsaB [Candidatus Binatia bacterium]
MRVLGIDTATQIASVGIVADGDGVAEASTTAVSSHTETLLPLLQATLFQARLSLSDLDAIGVSVGPGSFTGLRIALGTAKGLAYAMGQKVVGIPTLEALAHTVGDWVGLVCPLLDARKHEVYGALFRRSASGDLQKIVPEQVLSPASFLAQIREECLFLGDGVDRYGETIRQGCGPLAHLLPFATHHPRGAVVARLAWEKLRRGEWDTLSTLGPMYLRSPEAVLRHQQR